MTLVYALAAHDGRQFDFSNHIVHHYYVHYNFAIYSILGLRLRTRWTDMPALQKLKMKKGVVQYPDIDLNQAQVAVS